jgi:hypothetical protein
MTAESDGSMDEIELEIARTRARLANSADALASDLAPARLLEKGIAMFKGFLDRSTIGFGGGVRADPVALALIGLGVGWFVAENTGLLHGFIPGRGNEAAPAAEPIVAEPADEPAGPQALGSGNRWFQQAASATQGTLRGVYDRGSAAIEHAGEFLAHPGDASEQVRQAGGRMIESVERSPLALGLAGLAAGVAIAMLLPISRREREIATQARDDLWDKAEQLGHRAANSIRELGRGPTPASTDC